MRKILLVLMLFLVVACDGPNNKSVCIPSKSGDDTKALDGSSIASIDKIDQKLQEAKIISTIVNKIKAKVVGDGTDFSGAEKLFTGFVDSPMLQTGVSAAFSLFIIIYGIMVLSGMVQVTLGDAVIRVLKLAFIAYFALNWGNFYDLIGRASMDFTDEMLGYFMSLSDSKLHIVMPGVNLQESVFEKLDIYVAKSFSAKMAAVLSALMFSGGPSGPIYGLIMVMAIFFVFKAILKVVLVYCFSLFARAMLFAVAPIFITFMLFKPTQSLFDSWIRQLVNYSFQPVLVGAFLGFFLAIIHPFFDEFMKYHLCWQNVDKTKELYAWVFMDPETGNRVDFGANSKPAIEIQRILIFLGFAYLFYKATELGQNMASGIAGAVAGNLSDAAAGLGGLGNFVGGGKGGQQFKSLLKGI